VCQLGGSESRRRVAPNPLPHSRANAGFVALRLSALPFSCEFFVCRGASEMVARAKLGDVTDTLWSTE
jgi:hypothetical protein